MALYTKQQLKDAYFAKVESDPSAVNDDTWFAAEVIRVQAEIDARLTQLTTRKANVIADGTTRVNTIQGRIDAIEPDAKERMKDIALAYLSQQSAAQNRADNEEVDL